MYAIVPLLLKPNSINITTVEGEIHAHTIYFSLSMLCNTKDQKNFAVCFVQYYMSMRLTVTVLAKRGVILVKISKLAPFAPDTRDRLPSRADIPHPPMFARFPFDRSESERRIHRATSIPRERAPYFRGRESGGSSASRKGFGELENHRFASPHPYTLSLTRLSPLALHS